MAAITAQLYGSQTPPMVLVTVTGLTGVDRVNVWREPPAAARQPVRGGVDVDPSSDALVLLDVAPELGRPLVYVAETFTASAVGVEVSAAPVTVPDPGRHVLSDAYTGTAVLVDVVATDDERTRDARGSVLYPTGRARPVPLHDVRTDESGELVVWCRDVTEVTGLRALLDSGAPLVSRHPYDGCDVPGYEVLWSPSSSAVRRSRAGDRVVTLPFVVVDLPAPTVPAALVELADLAAFYGTGGTLAALAADFTTLLSIAQDDFGAA